MQKFLNRRKKERVSLKSLGIPGLDRNETDTSMTHLRASRLLSAVYNLCTLSIASVDTCTKRRASVEPCTFVVSLQSLFQSVFGATKLGANIFYVMQSWTQT